MEYHLDEKDRAYDFIIEKLKNEEWTPNKKILPEDVLAQEIGVSRIAVHIAVEKLIGMGVLKRTLGSEIFVNDFEAIPISSISLVNISKEDIVQILELRKHLEVAAVEMFVENASDDDIEELAHIYDDMVNNRDDREKFYRADFEYHKKIANGSKNRFLISIYNLLLDILKNQQKELYSKIGPQIGIDYHRHILNHIKRREVELAKLSMREHIKAAIDDFIKT